jgi:hypothetical protein
LALAVVQDLREHWAPATAEELADFETDVLAGFVLWGLRYSPITSRTLTSSCGSVENLKVSPRQGWIPNWRAGRTVGGRQLAVLSWEPASGGRATHRELERAEGHQHTPQRTCSPR